MALNGEGGRGRGVRKGLSLTGFREEARLDLEDSCGVRDEEGAA